MKIMKFGGTSVGSVDSIRKVKQIVEAEKEPVIVVVSALQQQESGRRFQCEMRD